MLTRSQQRRHAVLLRARDQSPVAQAVAAEIEARAELADAEAGRAAVVAESAAMVEDYPILGRITREGGKIIAIERPWTDADIQRVESQGVMISYQWCHDPMSGLRQGELIRIWIGTREAGPRVQWDHGQGWCRLTSRGNFGKNWSHGGNWRSDGKRYATLSEAEPGIAAIIGYN